MYTNCCIQRNDKERKTRRNKEKKLKARIMHINNKARICMSLQHGILTTEKTAHRWTAAVE
jgi:hypothetical protein